MKLSVKFAGVLTVAAAAMTAKMYSTAKGNHLKTHTFPLSKMKEQAASYNLFYFGHSQTSHRSRPFRKSAKPYPSLSYHRR